MHKEMQLPRLDGWAVLHSLEKFWDVFHRLVSETHLTQRIQRRLKTMERLTFLTRRPPRSPAQAKRRRTIKKELHAAHSEPADAIRFRHSPLDRSRKDFRLLEVCLPGDGDLIECKLHNETLTNNPIYVALSYTWDTCGTSRYIRCNGQLLKVGGNLWDFLFRYQFRGRTSGGRNLIWIDAICIDQDNVEERNHQVGQMKDIYSSASSVIVWLGETLEDAEGVFQALRRSEGLSPDYGLDLRDHLTPKQWLSLLNLLQLPYWQRVWIIQEFILAKDLDIWFSGYSISAQTLESLQRWQFRGDAYPEYAATSRFFTTPGWILLERRALWWRASINDRYLQFTLRRLFKSFPRSQSSDTRDRVYGFLGIASDTSDLRNRNQVDYNKTLASIAVDVIQIQQEWSSPCALDQMKFEIADFILRYLGVSHAEVAIHVLKHRPTLHRGLHALAPAEHVVIPLRPLCTVIDMRPRLSTPGFCSEIANLVASVMNTSLVTWGIILFPIMRFCGVQSSILENQRPVFGLRFGSKSKWEHSNLERPAALTLRRKAFAREHTWPATPRADTTSRAEILNLQPSWVDTFDCQRTTVYDEESVEDVQLSETMEAELESGILEGIFLTSNGLVGVVHDDTKPRTTDIICAPTTALQNRGTLILRPHRHMDGWEVVGPAILYSKRALFNGRVRWRTLPKKEAVETPSSGMELVCHISDIPLLTESGLLDKSLNIQIPERDRGRYHQIGLHYQHCRAPDCVAKRAQLATPKRN